MEAKTGALVCSDAFGPHFFDAVNALVEDQIGYKPITSLIMRDALRSAIGRVGFEGFKDEMIRRMFEFLDVLEAEKLIQHVRRGVCELLPDDEQNIVGFSFVKKLWNTNLVYSRRRHGSRLSFANEHLMPLALEAMSMKGEVIPHMPEWIRGLVGDLGPATTQDLQGALRMRGLIAPDGEQERGITLPHMTILCHSFRSLQAIERAVGDDDVDIATNFVSISFLSRNATILYHVIRGLMEKSTSYATRRMVNEAWKSSGGSLSLRSRYFDELVKNDLLSRRGLRAGGECKVLSGSRVRIEAGGRYSSEPIDVERIAKVCESVKTGNEFVEEAVNTFVTLRCRSYTVLMLIVYMTKMLGRPPLRREMIREHTRLTGLLYVQATNIHELVKLGLISLEGTRIHRTLRALVVPEESKFLIEDSRTGLVPLHMADIERLLDNTKEASVIPDVRGSINDALTPFIAWITDSLSDMNANDIQRVREDLRKAKGGIDTEFDRLFRALDAVVRMMPS